MKLYSAVLSPFASRVRLAIYAKGLDIEITTPPGGATRSPEYLAINPIGRVPALALDDGSVIPESDTIVEYLDDAFPTPPLRPASAEDKAKARLLARIGDLYLMSQGGGLFGQINPATATRRWSTRPSRSSTKPWPCSICSWAMVPMQWARRSPRRTAAWRR